MLALGRLSHSPQLPRLILGQKSAASARVWNLGVANAPETAFIWVDLSGEVPTSVGNQRDQKVQTFLPGAESSFFADAKVGERVGSWIVTKCTAHVGLHSQV